MAGTLYQVPGTRINDSWYAFDGVRHHAFFLEYPEDGDPAGCWNQQTVGHSSSADLLHWQYHGTVLRAVPGTWNDKGIATGSVVKRGDVWYMLYTGNAWAGEGGFGLAESRDLDSWRPCGDAPVIARGQPVTAYYEGKAYVCRLLADPYLLPQAIDGYTYAYVNAHTDGPVNQRGCQLLMRTRDLLHWEPYTIAALTACDRMKTAQVWEHGGRWYMYYGAVYAEQTPDGPRDGRRANVVLTAVAFDGPYRSAGASVLTIPGESFYIAKVLSRPGGPDWLLANQLRDRGSRVIGPYAVAYPPEGGITLHEIASWRAAAGGGADRDPTAGSPAEMTVGRRETD